MHPSPQLPSIPGAPAAPENPEHEVLVYEDGEASLPAPQDEAAWDWEADAVADGQHCQFCGAREPLFKLEAGGIACAECRHGR